MVGSGVTVLAASEGLVAAIGVVGVVGGAAAGAVATGFFNLRTSREGGRNKWLEFKRSHAHGFLQHIAVHYHDEPLTDEQIRLISHYYTLALALAEDAALPSSTTGCLKRSRTASTILSSLRCASFGLRSRQSAQR
jgi:hypothetical protein